MVICLFVYLCVLFFVFVFTNDILKVKTDSLNILFILYVYIYFIESIY